MAAVSRFSVFVRKFRGVLNKIRKSRAAAFKARGRTRVPKAPRVKKSTPRRLKLPVNNFDPRQEAVKVMPIGVASNEWKRRQKCAALAPLRSFTDPPMVTITDAMDNLKVSRPPLPPPPHKWPNKQTWASNVMPTKPATTSTTFTKSVNNLTEVMPKVPKPATNPDSNPKSSSNFPNYSQIQQGLYSAHTLNVASNPEHGNRGSENRHAKESRPPPPPPPHKWPNKQTWARNRMPTKPATTITITNSAIIEGDNGLTEVAKVSKVAILATNPGPSPNSCSACPNWSRRPEGSNSTHTSNETPDPRQGDQRRESENRHAKGSRPPPPPPPHKWPNKQTRVSYLMLPKPATTITKSATIVGGNNLTEAMPKVPKPATNPDPSPEDYPSSPNWSRIQEVSNSTNNLNVTSEPEHRSRGSDNRHAKETRPPPPLPPHKWPNKQTRASYPKPAAPAITTITTSAIIDDGNNLTAVLPQVAKPATNADPSPEDSSFPNWSRIQQGSNCTHSMSEIPGPGHSDRRCESEDRHAAESTRDPAPLTISSDGGFWTRGRLPTPPRPDDGANGNCQSVRLPNVVPKPVHHPIDPLPGAGNRGNSSEGESSDRQNYVGPGLASSFGGNGQERCDFNSSFGNLGQQQQQNTQQYNHSNDNQGGVGFLSGGGTHQQGSVMSSMPHQGLYGPPAAAATQHFQDPPRGGGGVSWPQSAAGAPPIVLLQPIPQPMLFPSMMAYGHVGYFGPPPTLAFAPPPPFNLPIQMGMSFGNQMSSPRFPLYLM